MKNLPTRRIAPATFVAVLCSGLQGQTPPPQVVVLLNGSVIQGRVERADDRLTVSKGPWYEVKVPLTDVDFVARSFREAYQIKRSSLDSRDFDGHLRLAQWCLRHGLDQLAGEQLLALFRIDPHHSAVRTLEQQLRRKMDEQAGLVPPVQTVSRRQVIVSPTAARSQLPALPPQALPEFTKAIQPLVLNRCGQATCHGNASQNRFRLTALAGSAGRKDRTWRNLMSVAAHVDFHNVDQSRLLIKAAAPHGSAQQAPFEPHEERQFRRLVDWVAAIAGQPTADGTADGKMPRVMRGSPADRLLRASSGQLSSEPLPAPTAFPASDVPTSSPSDPFDPAEFNRQFGGEPADDGV